MPGWLQRFWKKAPLVAELLEKMPGWLQRFWKNARLAAELLEKCQAGCSTEETGSGSKSGLKASISLG